jgi:hypothetical protein
VQGDRLGERLGAGGTGLLRPVAVPVAGGHQVVEAADVQIQPRRLQLEPGAVRADAGGVAEGVVERGERAAQGGPRVGVVGVGPQQGGELLATVGPVAARQVGEQCDRLAGVDPQRRASDLDARRSEQRQPELPQDPPPDGPRGGRPPHGSRLE